MDHKAYQVDILNEAGHPVATKRRGDVDKRLDFLHTVCVVLWTDDHNIILPRLIENTLGCSTATILRHDETTLDAARRALRTDFTLDNIDPTFIGSNIVPSIRRKISLYTIQSHLPLTMSDGYKIQTFNELRAQPTETLSPILSAVLQYFPGAFSRAHGT